MKRKNLVWILGTCLAVMLLCYGIAGAAEKEPVVGYNAGDVAFSAGGNPRGFSSADANEGRTRKNIQPLRKKDTLHC